MNPKTSLKFLPLLFLLALIFPVKSKIRYSSIASIRSFDNHQISIKDLESRLRPLLENKISRAKRTNNSRDIIVRKIDSNTRPSDYDFLLLAQSWNNLSQDFKSLYKKATQLPDSFLTYISPDNHFEIKYTLNGIDAVDPTDKYSYTPGNRSVKQEIKNGIPDYIDEVAWALDSSWFVQIDKFGLTRPLPFNKNDTSERYVVIVEDQLYNDIYGLTWVGEKNSSKLKGYSSYISLRNCWPSSQWSHLGYNQNPELGIRVTCAHEFFHSIQYSMSWNVVSNNGLLYLDNFPLSWIEGSATAMEDFIFREINDYLQYANVYFFNPGMSFFKEDNNIYTNSILISYLLKKTANNTDNFVSLVHKNNYASPINFYSFINTASENYGYKWPELLNEFHAASFFSGEFSDTNLFLSDAPLFNHWSFENSMDNRSGEQKAINSYAMEKFYIKPTVSDIDTLHMIFENPDLSFNQFAASIIVKKNYQNSIIPVYLDSNGNGNLTLPQWKNTDYVLAIITNGSNQSQKPYSVWFEHSNVCYRADSSYTINSSLHGLKVDIVINSKSDLRGELTFKEESFTLSSQANSPTDLFSINFPGAWQSSNYKSELNITLSIKIPTINFISDVSDYLYYFNPSTSLWENLPTTKSETTDTIFLSSKINFTGIYGLGKIFKNDKPSESILVYPNRIHFKESPDDSIFIKGAEISKVNIFSTDGKTVVNITPDMSSSLKMISKYPAKYKLTIPKRLFPPGLYAVVITYNKNSGKKDTVLRKIIVMP